jgi:hypothetical protein
VIPVGWAGGGRMDPGTRLAPTRGPALSMRCPTLRTKRRARARRAAGPRLRKKEGRRAVGEVQRPIATTESRGVNLPAGDAGQVARVRERPSRASVPDAAAGGVFARWRPTPPATTLAAPPEIGLYGRSVTRRMRRVAGGYDRAPTIHGTRATWHEECIRLSVAPIFPLGRFILVRRRFFVGDQGRRTVGGGPAPDRHRDGGSEESDRKPVASSIKAAR